MTAVQMFILIALLIGICFEQSCRIADDRILQKQIDELRKIVAKWREEE